LNCSELRQPSNRVTKTSLKEIKMNTLINTALPAFKMQAYHKNDFITVTDQNLKGKWSVLFFYPADFTFVCPTELGDMADKYEAFQKMGVEVYSVSTDTHFVHKAWHDASETIKKIRFPMLADPTGSLTRALGVHIEEAGLAYRGTFLVDPEGKIKLAEIQDNSIGRNADELLRKVQAAQFVASHPGEVCPAKWRPGDQTLKPGLNLVGKI
jgi:peroxiredoxin